MLQYILILFFLILGVAKTLGMCCLLAFAWNGDPFFTTPQRIAGGVLGFCAGVFALTDFIIAAFIFLN
jgi:hypothetical protein